MGDVRFSLFHLAQDPSSRPPGELYAEALELGVLAEQLGYDAVWLAEHHFSSFSVTPSPNLLTAALFERTERIRVGVMVHVLPFHNPLRVAEEAAMLDHMSGGRLAFGVGRGIQPKEFERVGIPMGESRERFVEAFDVIMKAWMQDSFSHRGKFHDFGELSLVPKPLQKPHPPIVVSAMSPDSLRFAAEKGHPTATMFLPAHKIAEGHELVCRHMYVAPTNEEARRDTEETLMHYWRTLLKVAIPADGPTSLPEAYKFYTGLYPMLGELTYDDLLESDFLVFGDPETCVEKILRHADAFPLDEFLCLSAFGTLPHAKVKRSLELFAKEVAPEVRRRLKERA
jgi:alkanesulfonate monooxygenase SsuD/methylene tetrahydromethanopterin reductase-like flavin-dependent oxidoreductase (luciferase family)